MLSQLLSVFALSTGLWLLGLRILERIRSFDSIDLFPVRVLLAHGLGGLLLIPFALLAVRLIWARRETRFSNSATGDFVVPLLTLTIVSVSGCILFAVPNTADADFQTGRTVAWWLHITLPLLVVLAWFIHPWSRSDQTPRSHRGLPAMVVGCLILISLLKPVLSEQQPAVANVTAEPASPSALPDLSLSLFAPSPVQTSSGQTIAAEHLTNSDDCRTCHSDVHAGWQESAHRFSSFNNPAYLAAFLETRDATTRHGDPTASRWCAGCHDPVPLLSGRLNHPDYDVLHDSTADAGITCTVCHSITHVNGTTGNGAYTVQEPQAYPFADTDSALLQWIRHQLIRVRPAAHRHTFLKEIHTQAEFCAACHKAHIPFALNQYRDFLRGQNHYDSWLLSGVSGHSARSFYYPDTAQQNCNDCHMPDELLSDPATSERLASTGSSNDRVRSHLFPAANTALPWLRDSSETVSAHQSFLQSAADVDLFGIRDGDRIDSPLTAPLRPHRLTVVPGRTYLLETVIRTLHIGHHLTQGTADSNQVWLEVTATSGDTVIGTSGHADDEQRIAPQAHFVNSFMLSRTGERISRRNVHDIFVPLYDHQIPPGAAQTVHYRLTVPPETQGPLTVTVRLLYRKFDSEYMQFIAQTMDRLGRPLSADFNRGNPLPVTVLAEDSVAFPVQGGVPVSADITSPLPEWRRWNDYGIGLLLRGRAELRQAADAFRQVEQLQRCDGPLNLARVLIAEGGPEQLQQAADALRRAAGFSDPSAPSWTVQWLSGRINRQQGHLETAETLFRDVLATSSDEAKRRGFDFSRDYVVNNLLGRTVFDQALRLPSDMAELKVQRLNEAVRIFQRTLQLDAENVDAHHNLAQLYQLLQQPDRAESHRALHTRYRPDDSARGQAIEAARRRYPHAGSASEPVVIYELQPTTDAR